MINVDITYSECCVHVHLCLLACICLCRTCVPFLIAFMCMYECAASDVNVSLCLCIYREPQSV